MVSGSHIRFMSLLFCPFFLLCLNKFASIRMCDFQLTMLLSIVFAYTLLLRLPPLSSHTLATKAELPNNSIDNYGNDLINNNGIKSINYIFDISFFFFSRFDDCRSIYAFISELLAVHIIDWARKCLGDIARAVMMTTTDLVLS